MLHHFTKILFLILAVFCFLHIYRDYLQIKKGYNTWLTRVGHVWHAPKYEKHGIAVLFLVGSLFIYLAIHEA